VKHSLSRESNSGFIKMKQNNVSYVYVINDSYYDDNLKSAVTQVHSRKTALYVIPIQ